MTPASRYNRNIFLELPREVNVDTLDSKGLPLPLQNVMQNVGHVFQQQNLPLNAVPNIQLQAQAAIQEIEPIVPQEVQQPEEHVNAEVEAQEVDQEHVEDVEFAEVEDVPVNEVLIEEIEIPEVENAVFAHFIQQEAEVVEAPMIAIQEIVNVPHAPIIPNFVQPNLPLLPEVSIPMVSIPIPTPKINPPTPKNTHSTSASIPSSVNQVSIPTTGPSNTILPVRNTEAALQARAAISAQQRQRQQESEPANCGTACTVFTVLGVLAGAALVGFGAYKGIEALCASSKIDWNPNNWNEQGQKKGDKVNGISKEILDAQGNKIGHVTEYPNTMVNKNGKCIPLKVITYIDQKEVKWEHVGNNEWEKLNKVTGQPMLVNGRPIQKTMSVGSMRQMPPATLNLSSRIFHVHQLQRPSAQPLRLNSALDAYRAKYPKN